MALSGNQYSVNNPAPISQLRAPRGFVLINGVIVPWERFEVSNTRYSAASTFHATIPVSSLPKTLPLATLLTTSPLIVQITAGIPQQVVPNNATPSDLPTQIIGAADEVKYDPLTTLITINGRDYIAKFADNKIGQNPSSPTTSPINLQTIMDQTSSAVITQIITSQGLTPVVTQTTTPIGKYFQNQSVNLATQSTEWDLMTSLARQEGFDIFAIGMNIYFQPKSTSLPYQITIGVPNYTSNTSLPVSNIEDISFTRNYRLAKNIIVKVSSWNMKDKATYQATATLVHTATLPQATQIFNYTFANLTQAQCTQKAQSLLLEISQHEMTVNIEMPADNLVTAHTMIAVKGTNTLFDQNYYVKNVTREMDFTGKYSMHIEAKSQSPYTVTVTNATN